MVNCASSFAVHLIYLVGHYVAVGAIQSALSHNGSNLASPFYQYCMDAMASMHQLYFS